MNDNKRTLTYVAVAALAVVVAWEPWRGRLEEPKGTAVEGQKLFPDFENPLAAKSLEIIQHDEAVDELREFSVKQVNGKWSIPSHENYPADAEEHMAQAATSVTDLKILGLDGTTPGEHKLYGVIEPDTKLKAGTVGVGMRVALKDGKGEALADLIVGKEVKDQPNLRYVRRTGKDQVYRVAVKTDKLSTKFEDWIEKDLLKFNSLDLRDVQLTDYNAIEQLVTPEGYFDAEHAERTRLKLAFDDEKSTWRLVDYVDARHKEPVAELAEDEELNTEKLNNLKTALSDLKIVDVRRKPEGLSRELRAEEKFTKDQEAIVSLNRRGFYPYRVRQGQIDILSSEGEAICRMKDGVEYILRFGQIVAADGGEDAKKDPDKPQEKKDGNSRLNRYLFVVARFNEDSIPKPKLEEAPGSDQPATQDDRAGDKPAGQKTDGPNASGKADSPSTAAGGEKNDKKPAGKGQKTDAKPAPAAKLPEGKPAAGKPAAGKSSGNKPAGDEPAADAAKNEVVADQDAKPAATDKKPADTLAADADQGDKAKQDKAADEQSKAADEKRSNIEKENKRKQDEYNDKVKKGQEHVKELNDRFADWYYVVSDEVYRKIHLSRSDAIKKKEKPAGKGDGVTDFDELQKGLPEAPKAPAAK